MFTQGDENSLTALLCQSADPNVQDHAGWTPLVSMYIIISDYDNFYISMRHVTMVTRL